MVRRSLVYDLFRFNDQQNICWCGVSIWLNMLALLNGLSGIQYSNSEIL